MTGPLSWLLLATHVPPTGQRGGMVRYVMELAHELVRHPDVELHVLTTAPSIALFEELIGDRRRVRTLPDLPTPLRSLLERPGYGTAAFHQDYDVIHGTKHLLPRTRASLRVLTVHDLLPIDRPKDFGVLKRRALVGPYRASMRSADVLLTVSQATRARLLVDQPSLGARAVAVPLAVSSSLAAAAPEPVPQLVGRRFALVVGDASPRKNLGMLIDLWDDVVARDPSAVLVTVGPRGWGVDARGARWDRLVEQRSVIPLQQIDDGVLRWCYENTRVVTCPSLLEGFGLPAVEALHFGAPLVTSLDPALVEASGPAALHLSAQDPRSWVDELLRRLATPRAAQAELRRSRTWEQVADETVSAVMALSRSRP